MVSQLDVIIMWWTAYLTFSVTNLLSYYSGCTWAASSALDNPGGGGCVYSFEVWTPNQDVLRRLRQLEHRCTNASLYSERHLMAIRTEVFAELMSARNISNHIEKEFLELKLEDVQLKVGQRDVRLELVEVKADTQELRTMLDEVKVKGGRHGKGVALVEVQQVRLEVSGIHTMVGQLKNDVGDLKAEWLLIKREVTNIRSENTQLKFSQSDLKDDTLHLKESMTAIQADTQLLKNQQAELRDINTKLSKSVGDLRGGGGGSNSIDVSGGGTGRVRQQIRQLETQNNQFLRELDKMKRDNAKLKREVGLLSMTVATRNLTSSDVDDWLRRMPNIDVSQLGSTTRQQDQSLPRDCHDIYLRGFRTAGVYQIKPESGSQLDNVYCEMINGTGWTLIQRRRDGTLSFNRRWLEYKYGFGNLYGEFWVGNQMIHWLTSQRQSRLRVDMWDWEGHRSYAEYDYFRVDSEHDKYMLHVRGYRGNAGDSLSLHDEMSFSTEDNDNDLHRRNCAVENKGGWWFNSCYSSNLNGVYHTGWYSQGSQTFADGIVWYTLKESEFYSLKHVELKIRPTYI